MQRYPLRTGCPAKIYGGNASRPTTGGCGQASRPCGMRASYLPTWTIRTGSIVRSVETRGVVPSVRIDPVEAIVSDALTPTDDLHEPVCPPESRCVICWDDDDSVIKALVADRDRLRVVFDEACWEIKTSHGKPCFCKYCTVSEADKAEGRKMEARLIDREQEVG